MICFVDRRECAPHEEVVEDRLVGRRGEDPPVLAARRLPVRVDPELGQRHGTRPWAEELCAGPGTIAKHAADSRNMLKRMLQRIV